MNRKLKRVVLEFMVNKHIQRAGQPMIFQKHVNYWTLVTTEMNWYIFIIAHNIISLLPWFLILDDLTFCATTVIAFD
jgi:hypothetical protein